MPFTQSPIEASIWTAFVAMQQWIVDNILLTSLFKAAVFTWLGILLMRALYQMSTNGQPGQVIGRYLVVLILSAVGFSILRSKSGDVFRPMNAVGKAWSSSYKVRDSGKYGALNSASANGLSVYVQIHRGANQIASFVSGKVSELFKNQHHNESPYLLLQTMAQTAGQTIDDPKAMTNLNWMFENCADQRTAPILSANSSYSALFDLSRSDCRERYQTLRRDLHAWAKGKHSSSWLGATQIALSEIGNKFGFVDETTLQNKMIASALVNTARQQMGRDNRHSVHTGALLGPRNSDPTFNGTASSYFTAMANTASVSGVVNTLLSPITGDDYWGADSRNQSAFLYNRIVQFLPPIRGYAKGLLALAFVFASASLCFGTPRFMVSWLGMLVVFTVYEPLSVILYESTMLFTNSKENTDALLALQSDPFVLSGAAIVDDNLARIQAVYFALQIGLAGVCAAAGISIFVFARKLGPGLSGGVVSKMTSLVHTVHFMKGGGVASGAGASPQSPQSS